jgi:hypothetical protein
MTTVKQHKSNDEFRGLLLFKPCYILCGQSVSINRGLLSYEFTICNALNYCLDSNSYYKAGKSIIHNFECLFDVMLIIRLVCIKQEESTASYGALEFTSAAENKADEWLSCFLFLHEYIK